MPKRFLGFLGIKAAIIIFIILLAAVIVGLAFFSAQARARDQHRLSDIGKIQQALKIFFDENGYYPFGNGTSAPTGLANYIDSWPRSPVSKPCPKPYEYNQKSQGTSYDLGFCLDQGVGGWNKGNHVANP